MSFSTLRPYFQTVLKTVDSDFREWEDGFSIENIPSNILDKSTHIALQPMNLRGIAHGAFQYSCPVVVRLVIKGFGAPQTAVDNAAIFAESIVKACCKHTTRLNQPFIKNVVATGIDIHQLSASNDNIVVLELSFDCTVNLDIE